MRKAHLALAMFGVLFPIVSAAQLTTQASNAPGYRAERASDKTGRHFIAPHSLIRPDDATQPDNVTGFYSGTLFQPNGPIVPTFHFEMTLIEDSSGNVAGESYATVLGTPYYVVESLVGQVADGVFSFQETGILSQNPAPGTYWCIKTGQLTTSGDGDTLSGPWQAPGCYPGTINISRIDGRLNGSECDSSGNAACGDPIDINTGNVFESFTDYQTSGQNKLQFIRYFNSRALGNISLELGTSWRSNFDRSLQISSSSVVAQRADGQQLTFTLSGTKWITDSDVDVTLVNSGRTWTLTDHDDTVETYTAASANQALLNSIRARNGYTLSLSYNSANQLNLVTDSYDRTLAFTYQSNGLLSTVSTPDATTVSYEYASTSGGGPNLISVTFPGTPSPTVTYVYANTMLPNVLTGIIDENGNPYATWTYDQFGRGLTSQIGNGANLTAVMYDDSNASRTVTNAFGVVDTYIFATLQGIPKVTRISRAATHTTVAATRTFSYDSNGYPASQTDWIGNKTTYVNNSHGLPTRISEAVGSSVARTTTIVYDPTWVHLPKTTTTPGLTTTFTYDASGELLTRKLADTTTTTAPYSTNGQTGIWTNTWSNHLLASVETPNGKTTKFVYYASGALRSITDPLGHVTNIARATPSGLPETIVNPNGVMTIFEYSPRQWPTSSTVTSTGGGTFTTKWNYDAAGNLTKTTLPDASYQANTYDDAHRLVQINDTLGEYTKFTLDALGDRRESNIYTEEGKQTRGDSRTFDSLGRLLVDACAAGPTTTWTYDPDGNATSVKDGLGHKTTNTYDALNRLSTIEDANGGVTTVGYDAHDQIVRVKDANGNTTSYVRDGFGDVIEQNSPDSGKTVYHYDADGNLTEQLNAAGVQTYHTYDALDRVLTTTYPADPAENVTFTYDQTGTGFSFGVGKLTRVTDAVGTLTRAYDERGNLLSEDRKHGSVTLTTRYTYDAASRIASITYPSGNTVSYSRDAEGQVTKVAIPTAIVASDITHLPFGPISAFIFGNGVTDKRTFDADYRMTTLDDAIASSTAMQSLTYAYDLANNLISIEDAVRSANTQTFHYDALNRLTSAIGGEYGTFAYTYDKVGNRLTEGRGSEAPTNDYSYFTATNRLASLSVRGKTIEAFTYTPTGNIVDFMGRGDPTISLIYNKADRIRSIAKNGTQIVDYTYDAFGQRQIKLFAGTPATGTVFAYGQDGSLLEETNIGGVPQADYIYLDDIPIGDFDPTSKTLYYLHTDHLGTPQLATNGVKGTAWKAIYEPFGWQNTVEGIITQNLRLPGQYFDSETTSYHNGFRDYVAILGRYGQVDPIGLAGGLNTYIYVRDNPTVLIDLEGTICLPPLPTLPPGSSGPVDVPTGSPVTPLPTPTKKPGGGGPTPSLPPLR